MGNRLRNRPGGDADVLLRSRLEGQHEPDGRTATILAFLLAALPAAIVIVLSAAVTPSTLVLRGLIVFGAIFALNSMVHSYMILAYPDGDKVAMNVGCYYMANNPFVRTPVLMNHQSRLQ